MANSRKTKSFLIYQNLLPDTFEPRSTSIRSSALPSSAWSFGSKANFGTSPHVRITTLPLSSAPIGTLSWVIFGSCTNMAYNIFSVSSLSASAPSIVFFISFAFRMSPSEGLPPFDISFTCARSAEISAMSDLFFISSASRTSTSTAHLRIVLLRFTKSWFRRIKCISSIDFLDNNLELRNFRKFVLAGV